jgi:hypothetical protein
MAVSPRPEIVQRVRRMLLGWLAACLTTLPLGLIAIAVIAAPPRDVSDLVFLLLFGLALTLAISAPSLVIAIVVERMGVWVCVRCPTAPKDGAWPKPKRPSHAIREGQGARLACRTPSRIASSSCLAASSIGNIGPGREFALSISSV